LLRFSTAYQAPPQIVRHIAKLADVSAGQEKSEDLTGSSRWSWHGRTTTSHINPWFDKGFDVAYYGLCFAGGTTGGGTASAAATAQRASTLAHLAAFAAGKEERDGSSSVRAVAFNAQNRLIGLAETPQDLKLALTIVTTILVKRHQILQSQLN
jgi:hypothetical protein